jgi:hypothetical protein
MMLARSDSGVPSGRARPEVIDADRRLHAIFMLLLDIAIVNVGLPPIARSPQAGFTDLRSIRPGPPCFPDSSSWARASA